VDPCCAEVAVVSEKALRLIAWLDRPELLDGPFGCGMFRHSEGRLFFDHIDHASNKYQLWGGVRVHF
jgi:hypothetical protein